jgi:hypothetical protein
MLLEKSSFHISKTSIQPSDNVKDINKLNNKEEGENSFWSWFKGLVNPLQNLPIISGIYSSFNSENADSDRDLVQNSLGGFLYGGPIGAIAGFGNWVFNKLFDKTPTELAFDITGVSKIWKNDKTNEDIKLAKINKEKTTSLNLKESISPIKITQKGDNINLKGKTSKIITSNNIIKLEQNNSSSPLPKPLNVVRESSLKRTPLIKDIDKMIPQSNFEKDNNTPEFREIEFKYPTWKPNLNVSNNGKINHKKGSYNNYNSESEVRSKEIKIDA